jgi:hypothetical protein
MATNLSVIHNIFLRKPLARGRLSIAAPVLRASYSECIHIAAMIGSRRLGAARQLG